MLNEELVPIELESVTDKVEGEDVEIFPWIDVD